MSDAIDHTWDGKLCVHERVGYCAHCRVERLEDALRRVVRDVNDYEEANKLSPNPGRTECWDSVAHAKAVLAHQK